MYERMLDKSAPPDDDFVKEYLGAESYGFLLQLEKFLNDHYDLKKELKFPFGNSYGWGYKYSHKSNHLCYTFFESGAFTVTLQLGDSCVPAVGKMLPALSEKANRLWRDRYPCGEQGGWIHYRVIEMNDLGDILELIKAKKKPLR
ncbi:hypothetical protein SDC9_54624 [bioreactor metagenome]|uniref:DUF3788 domain-containing protein n=1 Tax=bioreactor metagenome TaxID=1076179 RepID=A0A644WWW3_9ZZZZ